MLPKICLWTVLLLAGGCQAAKKTPTGPQPGVAAAPSPAPAPAEPIAAKPAPPAPTPPRHPPAEPEPVAEPPVVAAPAGPTALTAEQKAAFLAGDEERIFSKREHFTISNEFRHDLWFPYVRDLGGVYIGVASDQNYTLMAVARSEYGYLIDLDRQVVNLHRIYMALIAASADPEAFLARFGAASAVQKETRALLETALADMSKRDRSDALAFLADNREALHAYLKTVRATRRDEQGVTWLADPALYDYVRRMVETGRLRPINGNLLGKKAMATITASIAALGEKVEILYISNAEEYMTYTPQFAANIRALAVADDGVVLRTIHTRFEGWDSAAGDWRWNWQVQPLTDFQERLGDRKNNSRNAMLERANKEGAIDRVARGVSTFKKKTPPVPAPAG
jgi:hypothetical protein